MSKNVLVVDDAAFMRMMIKDILNKNGYTVVGEAENGMTALEKYKELKPDLVTMDITMPNGWHLCGQTNSGLRFQSPRHHVQRHGTTGHGNRCHTGRGLRLHSKALPA